MSVPLVSVLMTAFNREKYIAESIESVLDSDFHDFELVIVDDKSIDSTLEIAYDYASKDSRIKVVDNKKNLGDYPNRNYSSSYAKGKYIKFVDSDDKLYTNGLGYCVTSMERFPQAEWGIIFPRPIATEYVLGPQEALTLHFFKEPFLKAGPGQTILKRTFFEKIGKYPTKYGPANDMYFNLKAASLGKSLIIKDSFLFYRRHPDQEQSDQFSYLYNYNKYLKDAFDQLNLPLYKRELAWLQLKRKRRFSVNIIKYFIKTGNLKRTREALRKADFSFSDFISGIFHYSPKPEIRI